MVTKKSTVFFIFLIGVVGSWMFYLKYSVVSLEDRIAVASRGIINEKKNRHILRAEWKSLTSPERIQKLALKYLNLKQVEPTQLREFDPAIFHSDKTKKTKKLSKLVNDIMSQKSASEW
ncbi:MAG: hypothetical protein LBJ16_00745 [Holosporaceae bacterium]|jgi:hypothetical protein|nr:hypothetical protein [Holosporaceae bacterium]